MKRLTMILAVTLIAVLGAGTAMAQNPHFLSATATGPAANGDLTCKFKIAGLGSTVSTTVTCSADATAIYACQNSGGNFPNDPKKTQVSGPVTASGPFTSAKNGQIVGSLTLHPPASTLSCPGGQREVVCSVSYINVAVSEPSAGTTGIPGTYSIVVTACP